MELVPVSTNWHIYTIICFLIIIATNLLIVTKSSSFMLIVKRLKLTTPLFHMMNAFVAYTGGLIAAFNHNLNITVILMIAVSIFVMVLEIKRYKKMRVIKLAQTNLQEQFVVFAKKNYTIQIFALMITYIIARIF